MLNVRHLMLLALTTLLVAACATAPRFDTHGIDLKITPQQAVAEIAKLRGSRELWGGVIIASNNLKESTQLEILAYPLDSDQKPDMDKAPLGRFLAQQEGYLETGIYSQGHLLTVSGTLQETRTGRIGEAEYVYPVLKVEQLYLWPLGGDPSGTRFHFGVGVMLHN